MIYRILFFHYRNSISNAKVPTAERPVSPTSTFDRASLNSALTLSSSHGLPVSLVVNVTASTFDRASLNSALTLSSSHGLPVCMVVNVTLL